MSGPLGTGSGGGSGGGKDVLAGTGISVSGTTAFTVDNTGVLSLAGSGVSVSSSTGNVTVTGPTISGGTGISIAGGGTTSLTVSATGVNTVSAGTGISVSGTTSLTVSNTGVTSLAGSGVSVSAATGAVTVTAPTVTGGTGISVSGSGTTSLSISNSGVTGLTAGSGISVSGATGNVTITSTSTIPQFSFAESSTSPNNTVSVDSITAAAASTNADIALSPKGTGAILAQVPDGTIAGGNKRGANAVDLQTSRTAIAQVASGNYSVISGGRNNYATGIGAVVAGGADNYAYWNYATVSGGQSNNNQGTYSVISGGNANYSTQGYTSIGGGSQNRATQNYGTVPGGKGGNAELTGKLAFASNLFATAGDAQFGLIHCVGSSTSTTPVNLTTDTYSAFSSTNHLVLPNNRVYRFTIDIVANHGGESGLSYGTYGAYWKITGVIRRGASASTTAFVGTPTLIDVAADSALSGVSFTVLPETTTFGSLQIVATGLASTYIHWVATIMTTEVG